eukprot:1731403-Rhodomonas_salina.1
MDCEFLCHFQLPRIVSSHSAPPTSCTAKHLQNFYFQCLTAERAACSPSSSWALLCLCHLLCVRCHRSLLLLVHLSLLRQILSFCTCSLARKRKTERTAEEDTDISQKQRVDNWGRGGIQQRAGKGRQRDGGADRLPWPEVGQPLSLEAWYAGQYQTWYVGSVLGAWYASRVGRWDSAPEGPRARSRSPPAGCTCSPDRDRQTERQKDRQTQKDTDRHKSQKHRTETDTRHKTQT